ncbi:MAG: HEPN domain protein [candidate division TM6 bacterium GW2011_GWF2_38_10]|nr:MAG: HEPN domain protein [candidate division TM6 bacterium GW2011_GWF2_38_10]
MPGIKDWLRKSLGDVKLATKAIGDDETLDPAIYLTHQSVEKALKAFLVGLGEKIPKTHDLGILLDCCTRFDEEFILLQSECKILDPYGSHSRYPDDCFYVHQKDLIEAIFMAHKIFNFVNNKILC